MCLECGWRKYPFVVRDTPDIRSLPPPCVVKMHNQLLFSLPSASCPMSSCITLRVFVSDQRVVSSSSKHQSTLIEAIVTLFRPSPCSQALVQYDAEKHARRPIIQTRHQLRHVYIHIYTYHTNPEPAQTCCIPLLSSPFPLHPTGRICTGRPRSRASWWPSCLCCCS